MTFASLLTLELLLGASPAAVLATGASAPAASPSSAQAPLPPPPPPVDPATIAQGPWRGSGWFGLETGLGGPLDGGANFPSSSRVASFGWGMHIGYRAKPWLGVGLAFHRQPHDLVQIQLETANSVYLVDSTGFLNSYDLLVLRAFLPTDGRVQPWADLTGGLAVVQPAHESRPGGVGGQLRLGAGADFWIQQQISLDLSVHYRLTSVSSGPGHLIRGSLGVTFHW